MGAGLHTFFSALGSALQRIWLALFGRAIGQLKTSTDVILGDLRHDFETVKGIVDAIPGANRVTGLGTAMGDLSHSVAAAQGLGDRWLTTASNAGLLMFAWLLVGAAGAVAFAY